MRTYICACLWLLLGFINLIIAENQNHIVQNGIKLYDEKKYDAAIKEFYKVDENDSAYIFAQSELALTYIAKQKYDSALMVCKHALSERSVHMGHLWGSMATAYDELGERHMAINAYKNAIDLDPFNYLNHFNLAYTYSRVQEYEKAILSYQEALRCNPFHASSHLHLGLLSARQNQLTRAVLSLETFLLLEPHSNRSNRYLVYLENIAQSYVDTSYGEMIEPVFENNLLADIDHLIASRLVVNEDFEPYIDFNVAIVKQTEMLFEKLPFQTSKMDFWVEMYFPFFHAVKKNDHIESLMHTMLRSVGNDDLNKWDKKNEKQLKEFYDLGSEISKIKHYRDIMLEGNPHRLSVNFNDGKVVSTGNRSNDKRSGKWTFYNSHGMKSAEGMYVDGVKEGKWCFYNNRGLLDYEELIVGGKTEGISKKYHDNGKLSYTLNYADNKPIGPIDLHYASGELSEIQEYRDGKQNGPCVSFYASGDTSSTFALKDGKFDGLYRGYHPKGVVAKEVNYKNGLRDGEYKTYHPNGKLETSGQYDAGKQIGEWFYYYDNGLVEESLIYKDSLAVGPETEYFRNGNVMEENYRNEEGNYHGICTYYDRDGIKYRSEEFENGKTKKLICFDKSGKIIAESGSDDLSFPMTLYGADGYKEMQGFMKDGKRDSTWTYYWKNGNVKDILKYKDGLLNGERQEFFKNGNPLTVSRFINGEEDGDYKRYFIDGSISIKGKMKNGRLNAYWDYHKPNGKVWLRRHFLDGNVQGWQTYFTRENKIYRRDRFEKDEMLKQFYFNQNGDTLQAINLLRDKKLALIDNDGKVTMSVGLANYKYQDSLIWYYPDGTVSSKTFCEQGKRYGDYYSYYPEGQLRIKTSYVAGDEKGWSISYHDNGQIKDSSFYVDDNLEKYSVAFYENGALKSRKNYFNDELDGTVCYYDPAGNHQVCLHYLDGELVGYQGPGDDKTWSERKEIKSGIETISVTYNNGKPAFQGQISGFLWDGEKKYFSADGQVLKEMVLNQGKLHGLLKSYYINGTKKEEKNYFMGKINGILKKFYPNGKMKYSCEYYMGNKNGLEKFYSENGDIKHVYEYLEDNLMNEVKNY